MRILITGSRDFPDYNTVMRGLSVAIEDLSVIDPNDRDIIIVHGAATGADTMAGDFVRHARAFLSGIGYTIREERHPAEWDKFGKAAGPIRNQAMVDLGADICVAFFKVGALNKGTKHCSGAAKKAGIRVLEYEA